MEHVTTLAWILWGAGIALAGLAIYAFNRALKIRADFTDRRFDAVLRNLDKLMDEIKNDKR